MRVYSRREVIADDMIHALGVTGAAIAGPILMIIAILHGKPTLIAGVSLYGAGLLAMLFFSALYNVRRASPRRELYRRLDHAAIFAMIAGSYSPFTLGPMASDLGIHLFAFVWTTAVLGILLKLLFPRRLERLSVALYLALGWSMLATFDLFVSTVPVGAVALLGAGGLLYSLGVAFHLWRRLPYHNAIWHGLVLAAAACHYVAVLKGAVIPNGVT